MKNQVQSRTQEQPQHPSSPLSIIVQQNGSFYMIEFILVCLIENSKETIKIPKQHQRCILHRWAPDSWALDSGQLGPGNYLHF